MLFCQHKTFAFLESLSSYSDMDSKPRFLGWLLFTEWKDFCWAKNEIFFSRHHALKVPQQTSLRKLLNHTVQLIKKETNFILVLLSLNSTNHIVIHERFKELQKMNNLPPVPSNLIKSFGFYVKMNTNNSKPKRENNRFSFIVYRGKILVKLL